MRRYNYPYFGKRYLYDIPNKTLHDLLNEKDECKINSIHEDDIDMYSSLNEASLLMDHPFYYECPHCIEKKDNEI
ncbi:hypothetical protein ABG79_01064 [Caloramator mitchellensis]|uniref:Uncharacterized protein n=1 Tax=Caloramator mitchellensis TaxID=908809 RepID=A0A0R3JY64_CALMK|nr:hypothetical protein [Caloramator mitchellensis]KRQ87261.1 hypothetical protein ABG79_01064 [Caloramator mitchellensis]